MLSPMPRRRPRFSARPFFVSTAALLALAAVHQILPVYPARSRSSGPAGSQLFPRRIEDDGVACELVHQAADQCAFVRQYCQDEEAGLLPYLTFYYCTLGSVQPLAFAILVAWLGLLFTTIGIAASDFFSINLGTISNLLGLSESLAGVTFLAFGNGSPDVFSTFAAMGSHSGSMAVGELIGAAGFITAVVAGSMALVREFPVSRRTFVRDICFFIVAIIFSMCFLADGKIWLWECCAMIAFYAFYVATVVGWHWVVQRRKRRRAREALLRGEYYDTVAAGLNSTGRAAAAVDELAPYRDNPDDGHVTSSTGDDAAYQDEPDDTAPVGGRSRRPPPDISALERGPRIEISSIVTNPGATGEVIGSLVPDDDEEERNRHINAEMTSSMRVSRPRGRRGTTTTPIRPSLLGALEFRSVLSSLQRSGSVHMTPLGRRQSTTTAQYSEHQPEYSSGFAATAAHALDYDSRSSMLPPVPDNNYLHPEANGLRSRALSSGDEPRNLRDSPLSAPTSVPAPEAEAADGSGHVLEIPEVSDVSDDYHDVSPLALPEPSIPNLHLHIPHFDQQRHGSPRSSPSLSPFPNMADSPRSITPLGNSTRTSSFNRQPGDFLGGVSDVDVDGSRLGELPKPVRWWPYSVLPAPHVIASTLFPTLHGWREKTVWDKFVSLISTPTVFLLVATLPVVEMADDEEEDVEVEEAEEVLEQEEEAQGIETEWQRYRQSAAGSRGSRPVSRDLPQPPEIDVDSTAVSSEAVSMHSEATQTSSTPGPSVMTKPPARPVTETTSSTDVGTATGEWNRWLVVLQLFTGPVFTAFVIWANEEEHSGRGLLRAVLGALVASLVMLGVLLWTTTPTRRPRYHSLLCFLGFVISVAWISTVAGEVVGVLKAFGIVAGISEAILGLTIFAVGNSLGDLVADITVARLGYPVMALAACFGGPMLNILLGVGIGGAWMTTRGSSGSSNEPYVIEVGWSLMVSAITVLVTLLTLLVAVPANGWVMSRRVGVVLICIWTVSTVVNVLVEVFGGWTQGTARV